MKIQYRIILGSFVTALFVVGLAFGAINQTNITDVNETQENETNSTEISIETGYSYLMTANITAEPATPLVTTIEPTIPVSTTKPSPGFGIVLAIFVVLSAIYVHVRRR
jgi:PGF-CTERM protein